jgi:enhancing lycopene biosynthesis protein 2
MIMAARRVAVVVAGCGFLDGAEIHEAVCAMLALDQAGASYQLFAPDKPQLDVIDHDRQQPVSGQSRNVLTEAARIARGNIKPLSTLDMAEYDALVLPGGFGAAKNLVDYAAKGTSCRIDPDVERTLKQAHAQRKPIGAMCISPVVVAKALGADHHPVLTIGTDAETASDLEKLGARHTKAPADGVVVDDANRIVSTPAYMSAKRISEVWEGVSKLVHNVLQLAN